MAIPEPPTQRTLQGTHCATNISLQLPPCGVQSLITQLPLVWTEPHWKEHLCPLGILTLWWSTLSTVEVPLFSQELSLFRNVLLHRNGQSTLPCLLANLCKSLYSQRPCPQCEHTTVPPDDCKIPCFDKDPMRSKPVWLLMRMMASGPCYLIKLVMVCVCQSTGISHHFSSPQNLSAMP